MVGKTVILNDAELDMLRTCLLKDAKVLRNDAMRNAVDFSELYKFENAAAYREQLEAKLMHIQDGR